MENQTSSGEISPLRLYSQREVAALLKLRFASVAKLSIRWIKHKGVPSRTYLTTGEELLRYVRESMALR